MLNWLTNNFWGGFYPKNSIFPLIEFITIGFFFVTFLLSLGAYLLGFNLSEKSPIFYSKYDVSKGLGLLCFTSFVLFFLCALPPFFLLASAIAPIVAIVFATLVTRDFFVKLRFKREIWKAEKEMEMIQLEKDYEEVINLIQTSPTRLDKPKSYL